MVIAAAALLAALLLGGLPLWSRLVYGQSARATLLAMQFHKEVYTGEEAFQELLAQKRAANSQPYVLPQEMDFTAPVDMELFEGMQVCTLNGRAASDTLVLCFPGGSFTDQPRLVHWQFLQRLTADTGVTAAVPIYPKLPDGDAAGTLPQLMESYSSYLDRYPFERVLFLGDSAGGGLALSLAMQLRDAGMPGPEKLILLSPWVDLSMDNGAMADYEKKDRALDREMLARLGALWAGELDVRDPAVSPLYGDLTGLCPVELYWSQWEILCPDLEALSRRLDEAGVAHTDHVERGMFHVWPLYVAYDIPEAEAAYEAIAAAVKVR